MYKSSLERLKEISQKISAIFEICGDDIEDEHITPEQAHKNAIELAKNTEAWKGHEVLIATHIDRGHIHSHFIVNSVNYENGHKLQWM